MGGVWRCVSVGGVWMECGRSVGGVWVECAFGRSVAVCECGWSVGGVLVWVVPMFVLRLQPRVLMW